MEKWKRRGIDLLTSLIFGGRERASVVPYYPQKTKIWSREEPWFKRTVPERKGISSRRIYNMLCELESERRANLHRIKIICGGEVICECHTPGYGGEGWHVSYSMAKTVCGMVIGILCDRGLLSTDDLLINIFPEMPYKDKRFSQITVDHLLSMTAGVEFGEVGSVTETAWTEAFFSSAIRFTPGERFYYNSMNSYILAIIAERVSAKGFGSLAEELIFAPLGIKSYLWEKGSEGTEKGGWGLYLSAESWAKIGYMLLCGGVFDGRRVLSEEWVAESVKVKAIVPEENGGFNYAYHLWVGRGNGEVLFSGMLGQNLWICPKNDLMVVMNSGNNELFQASPALEIVRKYLGGRLSDRPRAFDWKLLRAKESSFFEHRRWARPLDEERGIFSRLRLSSRTPFDKRWEAVLGNYALAKNSVGVLPLILRTMQNNLNNSLREISIDRDGDGLLLSFLEGEERLFVPVGLYRYMEAVIDSAGESYVVRSIGEAYDGPDGLEYRIEIIFPETACVRRMVIRRQENSTISVEMSETPGDRLAVDYLKGYSKGNAVVAFTVDVIDRRFGEGTVSKTIEKTFNPTLIGVDKSVNGYESILERENSLASSRQSRARLVRGIVDKLFRENE